MSKRLVYVILALAAAFFYLWPRIVGYPSGPAPKVILELGPTDPKAVLPGTALTLDIFLEGDQGTRLGSFARPWHRFVTLRRGDGQALPWSFVMGAEPYGMFFAPGAEKNINFDKRLSSAAYFDRSPGYYTIRLMLSPEESNKITPGDYAIIASVEAARFPFLPAKTIAQSQPLTLKFVSASGQEFDLNQTAANAAFYIKTGQFSLALTASEELLKREPKMARSHITNGDALAGLGKKAEALAAYRRARGLLPPSYEEPVLLNDRIRSVQ